jgi:hypothetical protein
MDVRQRLQVQAYAAPRDWMLWRRFVGLSMMTLMPPLRNTYGNFEVISPTEFRRLEDAAKPLTLEKNYLIESKAPPPEKFGDPPGPSKFAVYVDFDKVDKKHDPLYELLPTFLAKIVDKSLNLFPRKYLLTKDADFNSQLDSKSVAKDLNDCFLPAGMGCNILRKIFITTYYADRNFKNDAKRRLAKLMRHSTVAAGHAYDKRDVAISYARTFYAFIPGQSVGWTQPVPDPSGGARSSAGAGSSADHAAGTPFVPRRRRSGLPPVAPAGMPPIPPHRLAGARAVLAEAPGPSVRPAAYVRPKAKFNRQAYVASHKAEAAANAKLYYEKHKNKIAGQRAVNRINNKQCKALLNETIDKHNIREGRNGKAFIARIAESEDDSD